MASLEHELQFIGEFCNAAVAGDAAAWEAIQAVDPGMLENPQLDDRFGMYSGRFAAGEPIDEPDDPRDQLWYRLSEFSFTSSALPWLSKRIREDWAARRQYTLLRSATSETERLLSAGNPADTKAQAERLSMELLGLHTSSAQSDRPQTFAAMLEDEVEAMHAEDEVGVTVPLPKLERACGPWMPGDVIGVSAFSNGGKSTFAANLTWQWARRGQPVLVYPTEMRERWVSRMLASRASVRQWIAEKRLWKRASDIERASYKSAAEEARSWPVEVVNRPNISPPEILASARVIRRRWPGQPVVVIVDHVHRLDYGHEDPNEQVGQATKLIRNFAGEDRDGGLIFVLLFQPRKPSQDVYRPIAGHEIRGDSTVWNEIDVHISPFRVWVKASESERTDWGTPKAQWGKDGPVLAKPNAEGAKLDDEHVYVKVDKRRVGGEGPVVRLDFHQPSGMVFEYDEETEESNAA